MRTKTCKPIVMFVVLYICGINHANESNGYAITGQVVDYLARPVEGAEIAVYEEEYRNQQSVAKMVAPIIRTDQQGHFKLRVNVSSLRRTIIVSRKEGLAFAWDGLNFSSNKIEKKFLLLVMEKPCTLTGVVVDHNGKVVSGVDVQAVPKTSYMSRLSQRPIYAPSQWFTTKTDSQGVFCFNAFAADVVSDFWVKTPDLNCTYIFTTNYQNCCGFEVGRRDIQLTLPQEQKIKGRVIEIKTDKPIGSVELSMRPQRDSEDILNRYRTCTVVADKNGAFECSGLPKGKNRIELVSHNDEIPQWVAKPVDVNIVPDQSTDDVEISVEKGGIVECNVREYETDKALCGINVSIYSEMCSARSQTDNSGKARLRVLPGDYKAYASGEGYISWRVNEPVVVKDDEITHLDVQLAKNPSVKGTIVDSNGLPAKGVLVTIHPFGDHIYTDTDGHFEGCYEENRTKEGLYIIARDMDRSLAAFVRTRKLDEPVQLSLASALTVKGRITDPNGAGIPVARISLCVDYQNCLSGIGSEVLSDSQGYYEFKAIPLEPSDFNYRISVHAVGFGPKEYDRISIKGEPGTVAEVESLQLLPANLSISGVVVDANGIPAARVPIFLRGDDGVDQPDKSTATNEKGQFTISRICKGPIRLQANFDSSPGGAGFLRANAGDQNVKIILGKDSVHRPYVSLMDKPLPELKSFNVESYHADANDTMILVCIWDMEQRPSRRCILELNKQAEELKQKGVTIIALQASKIDEKTLNDWVKKNNIIFPFGMIQNEAEKVKFTWGVRALPWLILTDSKHIVRAEGCGVNELEKAISMVADAEEKQ